VHLIVPAAVAQVDPAHIGHVQLGAASMTQHDKLLVMRPAGAHPHVQQAFAAGEDQPIVREGIVHVLTDGGFEVVGTAADARELVRKAHIDRPDVVVTDIQMPPDHANDGLRGA
jgi:hypothetical protein